MTATTMNEEDSRRRIEQARQFARIDLDKVASGLAGGRTHIGLLFSNMEGTFHWAVEAWLGLQGDTPASGWPDQEARFLRIAPRGLQDRYLEVVGGMRQLAARLIDILGTDRTDEVLIAAPVLDHWRQQAQLWLEDARALAAVLTDPEPPLGPGGARRIVSGALFGNLQILTPCLILARIGSTPCPWIQGGPPPGLFDIGAPHATQHGALVHSGLILPLSYCHDASLQERLRRFAKLMLQPLGVHLTREDVAGLPVDARSRRHSLQGWLDTAGLDVLRLVDKEPLHRWTRLALTPAVFRSILSQFDYVSAVEYLTDETVRVVEWSALGWSSQCEILEWCRSSEDEDDPLRPFGLYLVAEIYGFVNAVTTHYARKRIFRPVDYWARIVSPTQSLPIDPVAVRLESDRLRLSLGDRTAEVFLSDIDDPFPTLLEWLQLVATGDLPIGFDIDDEGDEARILAHACGEGRLLVAVLDRWKNAERIAGVVDSDVFLTAFRRELVDFFSHRFDVETWLYHEDEQEQQAYLDGLLGHPFLVDRRELSLTS